MSNTNSSPTILVTGATGNIGSQVVEALRARGSKVIAAGRSVAQVRQRHPGVAAVEFDYERPETFVSAFAGVDVAFILPPATEGFAVPTIAAIDAARSAGVKHIVRHSAVGASSDGFFEISRQHGLIDDHLREQGDGWTLLQPTFYQDNVLNFQGQAIVEGDAFYGSSGNGKVAYVASSDIAEVATAVLSEPRKYAGQVLVITGAEALSDEELAGLLSKTSGRTVRYVDVGDEALRQNLIGAGSPPWYADSLVALEQVKRNGWAEQTSDTVQKVLGRAPTTYSSFLEAHRSRLVEAV